MFGVSIIICCYNSAGRLRSTLAHLKAQLCDETIPWEVILVDNGSTDNTGELARELWGDLQAAPLRVENEKEPGLIHARRKGFEKAAHEYVSFIDDDNWVSPTWVSDVYQIMAENPQVGACGGRSEPVYEASPPSWFENYWFRFALGDQGIDEGDITDKRGWLWGAGLTVRKSAWRSLQERGLRSMLVGRSGAALTSGEDNELCYLMRALNWRLYYSRRLCLKHFIPKKRLSWNYLTKLVKQNGRAVLVGKAYTRILQSKGGIDPTQLPALWLEDLQRCLRQIRNSLVDYMVKRDYTIVGNRDYINILESWTLCRELIKLGPRGYQKLQLAIQSNLGM